jgi:glycine hydroxymethyltransferase
MTNFSDYSPNIKDHDEEIHNLFQLEAKRLNSTISLIASENSMSPQILASLSSVFNLKYAEGYPGKRYYGGCDFHDKAEDLARQRLCALFGAEHANVQPHSGAQANHAVFLALLSAGDKILGMDLSHGGHLTHGCKVNFSGLYYDSYFYGVSDDGRIDYDLVQKQVQEIKPKVLIAGASAYPRIIDFKRFREIADSAGAYLLVDMAHIAGLIASGLHPSPVPFADVITSTTHKTLRGPRGGIILCKKDLAKKIDKAVFPGLQGGPNMAAIAAKAVAFKEALSSEFKSYSEKVVENAQALSKGLIASGLKLVSGGTDNHLILVDLKEAPISGQDAQDILKEYAIIVNKNTVPNDPRKPMITSGIRLGSPSATTRGMNSKDMLNLGVLIGKVLKNPHENNFKSELKSCVETLVKSYPIYKEPLNSVGYLNNCNSDFDSKDVLK